MALATTLATQYTHTVLNLEGCSPWGVHVPQTTYTLLITVHAKCTATTSAQP